jgi:hypothetical protein
VIEESEHARKGSTHSEDTDPEDRLRKNSGDQCSDRLPQINVCSRERSVERGQDLMHARSRLQAPSLQTPLARDMTKESLENVKFKSKQRDCREDALKDTEISIH